ncbi:Mitotic spindle checkpoint protein [Scedosporium apiospermum]|uniref:Mitotic spindle checkpoint protein n=1 Tax=Pseudallescheria apiosperma TaxID=563466 RepID=A0A084G261_PSEDA|nr:Mitotic spindle checkpoint protein [Scedosporium apiospermum]KEZ41423.1 Mitotic spindle checkpoint protein [Scedosporium apiospermum]
MPPTSIPLSQAKTLLARFTTFLTAAIHTILYHRRIYPPETFLTTRSHNLPIHQSRHPALCAWINDAVAAVVAQIRSASVRRVALVIHAPPDSNASSVTVVERWVFDIEGWPAFPESIPADFKGKGRERSGGGGNEDEEENGGEVGGAAAEGPGVNWVDVQEQLRAALRRISYAGEKLGGLPAGCTFTVAVELNDEAPAPIGHPQAWIPSEPNLQPPSASREQAGKDVGGRATPIRSVEAGPLFFECWVEEGDSGILESLRTQSSQQTEDSQSMPLA